MKTTIKRSSAWVLVLCMILLNIPMQAQAVTYTNPTVSATAVTGAPGETVDVEIVMHNNPGIVSMVMRVGYDSSVLTLKSVTDAGILGTQVHSDDYTRNPYQLTWANDLATTNYTANGTLVTLHFEIAADAEAGTYPIEVSYTKDNFEIFDCDANELDVDTAPGSVTVTAVAAACTHANKTTVPAKASTCVAHGNNLYYTCPDCGKVLKADGVTETTVEAETLPLTGHTGGTATCEGKAVCTVCSQPYGELGDHTLEEVPAKSPSCTASGNNRYYTCGDCGLVFKADGVTETTVAAETIAATGHSYTYKVTTEPTTTAAGALTGICASCSGTTTVTLPKLNTTDYSYSVITEPTTTAEGTGRYTWKTTTYGNFSFDVTLDVVSDGPVKAEIYTYPAKTVYQIGESLNTDGLSVILTYGDGSTEIVTTGFSFGGFYSDAAGVYTVKVACQGVVAMFPITVVENTIDETTPMIVIDSTKAKPGETVTVNVSLKNNPGFSSVVLMLEYDTARLQLDEAAFAEEILNNSMANYNLPYVALVSSGDITTDTTLLTLTFTVLSDASDGEAYISVRYEEGDITNYDEEDLSFTVSDGRVTVTRYTPGDINDDGKVNTKDLTRLLKYLSHEDVYVNEFALDVNGDGKVNTKDLTRLLKYLSHEDVELH